MTPKTLEERLHKRLEELSVYRFATDYEPILNALRRAVLGLECASSPGEEFVLYGPQLFISSARQALQDIANILEKPE